MAFYGETINNSEAPFVFDKVYSSRYQMEKAMESDGIYAGRFVLISYDSSYTHNSFIRAYIKEEDQDRTSGNITLYKDSTLNEPIKYKDDYEITSLDIYYVTDGYIYTYYKCSGKDSNEIAIFEYYTTMNKLFSQAFRDNINGLGNEINLFLDSDLTTKIQSLEKDAEDGVQVGDIVFVRETALEQSDREQEYGIFTYYECTGFQDTKQYAIFKNVAQMTGRYKDNSLENYLTNQKLDKITFGLTDNSADFDKTVWQKVFIGDKEKYIKIASLNVKVPEIKLSYDAPQEESRSAPYFDGDVNGNIKDLHVQPQWGLRIASADKTFSTESILQNPNTGEYITYQQYIKNQVTEACNNFVTYTNAYESQVENIFSILNASFEDKIDDIPTDILTESDQTILINNLNKLKDFTSDTTSYDIVIKTDIANTLLGETYTEDYEDSIEYSFKNYITQYQSTEIKENYCPVGKSVPLNLTKYKCDGGLLTSQISGGTTIYDNSYYLLAFNNLTDLSSNDVNSLKSYITNFLIYIDTCLNSYRTINTGFNESMYDLLLNTTNNIRTTLTQIFSFDCEDPTSDSYDITLLQTPLLLYIYSVVKNDTQDNIDSIIDNIMNKYLTTIADERNEVYSDQEIEWKNYDYNNNIVYFNGEEWISDNSTIPGAIYFNKAGFDKTVPSYVEMEDEGISLLPTGFKQYQDESLNWNFNQYTDKNSTITGSTVSAPDTYEMSINLPSLGNAVSEMWDIVYGEADDNTGKRNTSITWDTTGNATRLVTDEDDGYGYDLEGVTSVAGVINSVQDLMGRIIDKNLIDSDNDDESVLDEELTSDYIKANANKDHIYYFAGDKKYYIVNNGYDFDNIDDDVERISTETDYVNKVQGFDEITLLNPDNIGSDYYFLENNNYIQRAVYNSNKSYVTLQPTEINFKAGYRLTSNKNLTNINTNGVDLTETYLDLGEDGADIIGPTYLFIPGECYTQVEVEDEDDESEEDKPKKYVAEETFDSTKVYYVPKILQEGGINNVTGEILATTYEWVKIYDPEDDDSIPLLTKDNYYCYVSINLTEEEQMPSYITLNNLDNEFNDITIPNDKSVLRALNAFPGAGVNYNIDTENDHDKVFYGVLKTDIDVDNISNSNKALPKYEQNKYYYQNTGSNNYYLDTSINGDINKVYYSLESTNAYLLVYEANTYYYKDEEDNFTIDINDDFTTGRQYYTHAIYYVTKKYYDIYRVGMEWDYTIPWSETFLENNISRQTNRKYFYDENCTKPAYFFTSDFDSVKNLLYIESDESMIQVGDENYDSTKQYYIQIESTATTAEEGTLKNYIVNQKYSYNTKYFTYNDSVYEYDITNNYEQYSVDNYNFTEEDDALLNKVKIVSGAKYLLINFETWQAGSFYYKNDYSEIISEVELVKSTDLEEQYYFQELEGFARSYNTIHGLILSFNKLLGDKDGYDRNVKTIYGSLRTIQDEINRLQLYDSGVVKGIVESIKYCYTESQELLEEIAELRGGLSETALGYLTEEEAVDNYVTLEDLKTIIGYDNLQRSTSDKIVRFSSEPQTNTDDFEYELVKTRKVNDDTTFYYYKVKDLSTNSYLTDTKGYNDNNVLIANNFILDAEAETPSYIFENSNNNIVQEIEDINSNLANKSSLNTIFGFSSDMDINAITLGIPDGNLSGIDQPPLYTAIENLQTSIDNLEDQLYGQESGEEYEYDFTNSIWVFNTTDSLQLNSKLSALGTYSFDITGNIYLTLDDANSSANSQGEFSAINVFPTYIQLDTNKNIYTTGYSKFTTDYPVIKITGGDDVNNEKLYSLFFEQVASQINSDIMVYPVTCAQTVRTTASVSHSFNINNTIFKTELESLNTIGLLARIAKLDANLADMKERYEQKAEADKAKYTALLDELTELRKDYKNNVLSTMVSTSSEEDSNTNPSSSGLTPVVLSTVESKYGFRFTSIPCVYTIENNRTTLTYSIRVSFSPTETLSAFDQAFLQIPNVSFIHDTFYLTVTPDANTNSSVTTGLTAYMKYDGTIYLKSNDAWPAVSSSADSYTFTLSGTISEIPYATDSQGNKTLYNTTTYSLKFRQDSGMLQDTAPFSAITVSINYDEMFAKDYIRITIPKCPATPVGLKFVRWQGVNNSNIQFNTSEVGKSYTLANTSITSKIFNNPDDFSEGLKETEFIPIYEIENANTAICRMDGQWYAINIYTTVAGFALAYKDTAGWCVVRNRFKSTTDSTKHEQYFLTNTAWLGNDTKITKKIKDEYTSYNNDLVKVGTYAYKKMDYVLIALPVTKSKTGKYTATNGSAQTDYIINYATEQITYTGQSSYSYRIYEKTVPAHTGWYYFIV